MVFGMNHHTTNKLKEVRGWIDSDYKKIFIKEIQLEIRKCE